jgi:hypothetical protein
VPDFPVASSYESSSHALFGMTASTPTSWKEQVRTRRPLPSYARVSEPPIPRPPELWLTATTRPSASYAKCSTLSGPAPSPTRFSTSRPDAS